MMHANYETLLMLGMVQHMTTKLPGKVLPFSKYFNAQNTNDLLLYDDRHDLMEHQYPYDYHQHRYNLVCDFMIEDDDNPFIIDTYNDQFEGITFTLVTNDMINDMFIEVKCASDNSHPIIIRNGKWYVSMFS